MEEESTRVEGGCLCGAVRYEAQALLHNTYYCHCRTCQRASGAPAEASVPVKPGSLHFTGTEPRYFRSSPFAERGFCSNCGSRLMYRMLSGDYFTVTVGSLDHPESASPEKHYCVESQIAWYKTDDKLPRLRTDEVPELVALWSGVEQKDA